MTTQAIRYAPPFCAKQGETQTSFSYYGRIAASALGAITLLAGVLALSGVSGFHAMGTAGGSTLVATGALILLASLSVRAVKIHEPTNKPEAILYMSISGNPAHMGHMAALGTAIRGLRARQVPIKKAYVSLSSQAYIEQKSKNTLDKIRYTYQERIQFLQSVIDQARQRYMFGSVEVEFWDDQEEGYSDHPISYHKLVRENPFNKVFLITGIDLCRSMNNWRGTQVAHAIVITRTTVDAETAVQIDTNGQIRSFLFRGEPFVTAQRSKDESRILLRNAFPEYAHYSSTAIRTNQIEVSYPPPRDPDEVYPLSQGSLMDISTNTMQLMEQGFCRISDEKIVQFKAGSELHETSSMCMYNQPLERMQAKYEQREYVEECDSFDVALRLVLQGHKVAVVNFAGADSAGGGFLEGTGGQEETLLYRCDLANLMKYYYDKQLECDHDFRMYPLYDHLIHTPEVTVFRNRRFEPLEEPFTVDILSSAAPVSKCFCPFADTAFEITAKTNGEMDYVDETTRDLMRRTIYTQLKAAYDSGCDAIVLGAFGCGAFENPPDAVAKLYHQVIDEYFNGAFRTIAFAILDGKPQAHNPRGNLQPFRTYFPDAPGESKT